MENLAKSILTMVIWLLVGGIAITALIVGNVYDVRDILIPSFLATLIATFIIWAIPELARSGRQQSHSNMEQTGKNKRVASSPDERMNMLMALMTEEEREDFKQTLKRRILADSRLSSDGEFMNDSASLDSLLYDEQQEYYRQ